MKHFFKFDIMEFVFKKFLFSGVLSRQEFVSSGVCHSGVCHGALLEVLNWLEDQSWKDGLNGWADQVRLEVPGCL